MTPARKFQLEADKLYPNSHVERLLRHNMDKLLSTAEPESQVAPDPGKGEKSGGGDMGADCDIVKATQVRLGESIIAVQGAPFEDDDDE